MRWYVCMLSFRLSGYLMRGHVCMLSFNFSRLQLLGEGLWPFRQCPPSPRVLRRLGSPLPGPPPMPCGVPQGGLLMEPCEVGKPVEGSWLRRPRNQLKGSEGLEAQSRDPETPKSEPRMASRSGHGHCSPSNHHWRHGTEGDVKANASYYAELAITRVKASIMMAPYRLLNGRSRRAFGWICPPTCWLAHPSTNSG